MSDQAESKINDIRDLYRLRGCEALSGAPAHEWHPPVSTLSAQDKPAGEPSPGKKRILPYKHHHELGPQLQSGDLVHNLLTLGDVSVLYGASNVGKSFWALDLAAHVSNNLLYRGKVRVHGGAVVYVTLEGRRAFANRIAALETTQKLHLQTPLYVINSPFSLLNEEDYFALVDSIKEIASRSMIPARLVVIDTLGRAMAGGDENSSIDMTSAIKAVDAIKGITGAHVMLVHHSGKNESRGARGHSSLRAAVDTEIEISRSEESSLTTVLVTKQRDLPVIPPMYFQLKTVCLGRDEHGAEVTSCVVQHDLNARSTPAVRAKKSTTKTMPSHQQILTLVPDESTIHKGQFKEKLRRECHVTAREADTLIHEMLNADELFETTVWSGAGQRCVHLTRRRPE